MKSMSSQGLPCCCYSAGLRHSRGTWLTLMHQNSPQWHQLEFDLLGISELPTQGATNPQKFIYFEEITQKP